MASVKIIDSSANVGASFSEINNNFTLLQKKCEEFFVEKTNLREKTFRITANIDKQRILHEFYNKRVIVTVQDTNKDIIDESKYIISNISQSSFDISFLSLSDSEELLLDVKVQGVEAEINTLKSLKSEIDNTYQKINNIYDFFNKNTTSHICCTKITLTEDYSNTYLDIVTDSLFVHPYNRNIFSVFDFNKNQWLVHNFTETIKVSLIDEFNNPLSSNSIYDLCIGVIDNEIVFRFKKWPNVDFSGVLKVPREIKDDVLFYTEEYEQGKIFFRVIGCIQTDLNGKIHYNSKTNFNITVFNIYNKAETVLSFTDVSYILNGVNTLDTNTCTLRLYKDNILFINNIETLSIKDQDTIQGVFDTITKIKLPNGYNKISFLTPLIRDNNIERGQVILKI